MQRLLLCLAFLLPLKAGTEDIIGGDEARPHSRPYMALLHFVEEENEGRCGGALVRKEFVLMAAHCRGSSIHMTLGAYNIREQERTQKVLPVTEAIHHPHYNPKNFANGIMLLKSFLSLLPGVSGGPFVCENVLQGISSYGPESDTPPGVSMEASPYLPWMKRTMKRCSQQV
nr:granzyme H-like [Equus caballus]